MRHLQYDCLKAKQPFWSQWLNHKLEMKSLITWNKLWGHTSVSLVYDTFVILSISCLMFPLLLWYSFHISTQVLYLLWSCIYLTCISLSLALWDAASPFVLQTLYSVEFTCVPSWLCSRASAFQHFLFLFPTESLYFWLSHCPWPLTSLPANSCRQCWLCTGFYIFLHVFCWPAMWESLVLSPCSYQLSHRKHQGLFLDLLQIVKSASKPHCI